MILHDEGAADGAEQPVPERKEVWLTAGQFTEELAIESRGWRFGRGDENLLFVAELVANPPNGQHHLRIFRVLFDLGSQPIDV